MHGTGVPVVTPFAADDSVDHERLASLVTWLEAEGVDFLVPCGSTGEAPLLSTAERRAVVETVVNAANVPVLAGTGLEGFEPTVAATRDAAAAGAGAALVVTPSYYGVDESDLVAYYDALADESPIPIYLYSVPQFTDVTLSPDAVATLAPHEGIAGIKDSAGNVDRIQETVARTTDETFDVIVGSGSVYASALDVGATGGILAIANVLPDESVALARAHADGDGSSARTRQLELARYNRTIVGRYGIAGVKEALGMRGQPVGRPRRPLRRLDDAHRATVRELLTPYLDD